MSSLSFHESNMSRIRESSCNADNIINDEGKRVLTQHNRRQPLGVFPNVGGKQAQFVAPDVGFAKSKSESIVIRSQTACQESAFKIDKDFEGTPRKSKEYCFRHNEMETAEEEKDHEDIKAERDEMEEEEDEYEEEEEEEDVSYLGLIKLHELVKLAECHSEEKNGVDSEMADVRRCQRAGVNENYDRELLVYSLMVEVADEYKLKRETLFLAINYLDSFLNMNIARSELQLVGTAALFVASKYEEVYPPSLDVYVLVTDRTYTGNQLLQMEHTMFKNLVFQIAIHTSIFFCLGLLNQFCLSEVCCIMSLYNLEAELVLKEEFMKYYPRVLSPSSLISFILLENYMAQTRRTYPTSYAFADLVTCLVSILETLHSTEALANSAVKNEFSVVEYHGVCVIAVPDKS